MITLGSKIDSDECGLRKNVVQRDRRMDQWRKLDCFKRVQEDFLRSNEKKTRMSLSETGMGATSKVGSEAKYSSWGRA